MLVKLDKMKLTKQNNKTSRKASRIIKKIEFDGGVKFECGCFFGMSSNSMRVLMSESNPREIIDTIDILESWHDCLFKSQDSKTSSA